MTASRATAPDSVEMERLTFAVVAKSADTHELTAQFCARLEELTAIAIRPRVLTSYADMLPLLEAAEIDLAWAPPLVAMRLEERPAARLLTVVQRKFSAGYHSALFTRDESGLRTVHELEGVSVAWVSEQSASGYRVPRWHLKSQGVDLERAFGKQLFFPTHEGVARSVCAGEADVGATHVAMDPISGRVANAPWLPLTTHGPKIRILLLVGPIPGDVIVARAGVASEVRRQLTAALLALRPDDVAVGPLFDATSFEPVPDGHLALLRRLSRYASDQQCG
jgi:phosphonate transport system substrate-binding protein